MTSINPYNLFWSVVKRPTDGSTGTTGGQTDTKSGKTSTMR